MSRRRPLQGGTWNMRHRRGARQVATDLKLLLNRYPRLDFLVLNEAQRYAAILDALDGWDRVARQRTHTEHQVILVRRGVHHGPGYQRRMSLFGYLMRNGHRTLPKNASTVELDGWLRVVGVHEPPHHRIGTEAVRRQYLRRLTGFLHRHQLARYVRRHGREALVAVGDWNQTPDAPGIRRLARRARMAIRAPQAPTHGKRTIDYPVSHGCRVTDVEVGPRYRSDHHVVTFIVHPPGGGR